MGIIGLTSFVQSQAGALLDHRLCGTPIVIDGSNLVHKLYAHCIRVCAQSPTSTSHLPFGGDYVRFAECIVNFLDALTTCDIVPIIVLSGTSRKDQLNAKLVQFIEKLKSARKFYDCPTEINHRQDRLIHALFNRHVLVQIAAQNGHQLYQTALESHQMISTIANQLCCPVLSDDNEYFLRNIKEGIVSIDSVLANVSTICRQNGVQYLNCKLYRVSTSLQGAFPGLKVALIPLAGSMLANIAQDKGEKKEVNRIIGKCGANSFCNHFPFSRQFKIYRVFKWLSLRHASSLQSAIKQLQNYCRNDLNHPVMQYIYKHRTDWTVDQSGALNLDLAQYIQQGHIDLLLAKENQSLHTLPNWIQENFASNRIQKRLVSIVQGLEFCEPLIEDHSLNQSTYDCTLELEAQIYGLVLQNNNQQKQTYQKVQRFVRSSNNGQFIGDNAQNKMPSLDQLTDWAEDERIRLFAQMLNIEHYLIDQARELFSSTNQFANEYVTMLLSLIYFCHHLDCPVWVEFVYALFANVMLSFNADQLVSTQFHNIESSNLAHFNSIPTLSQQSYTPRIVHQYNSFQTCLQSICFLAELLNLSHLFNANQLILTLQGTFIYNLTTELMAHEKPLSHLECELLVGLHRGAFDFVLRNSQRIYYSTDQLDSQAANRDVVPEYLVCANYGLKFRERSRKFFVRGSSV